MLYPNLEAEIARHGYTQRDVAETIGKTPETISCWMNGKRGEFPVSACLKIKQDLFPECTVDYLFDSNVA